MGLNSISLLTIIIFFVLSCIAAFYYSQGKISITEYFIGSKKYSWWVIGFIAFLTNTSTNSLFSFAAKTSKVGIASFNPELTGIICCVVLALVFSGIYKNNNFYTTAQFMEVRFSRTVAYITSFLLIFVTIVARISGILIALHLIIFHFLKIDVYTTSILIIMFCGAYSIVGGQKTAIHTGLLIGFIVLGGTLFMTISVWNYFPIQNTGYPDTYFSLLRKLDSNEQYSWFGVIFGLPILGIFFHCINQPIVQNFLGAKDHFNFQAGALFHGYLKLLIFPIAILPGILAHRFGANLDGQILYPELIQKIIPESLKGLIISAAIGTAMITLSASFNACSTLFTFDFYKKINPNANEFMTMNIGKIATIFFATLSMIWMVLINSIHADIPFVITSCLTFFTPPIVAVYLFGIFWKRATSQAAFYTLLVGFIIGIGKFLNSFKGGDEVDQNSILYLVGKFNIYNFTVLLFVFSSIVMVVVSLYTKAPDLEKIKSCLYSYNKPLADAKQKRINIAAFILLGIIAGTYLIVGF